MGTNALKGMQLFSPTNCKPTNRPILITAAEVATDTSPRPGNNPRPGKQGTEPGRILDGNLVFPKLDSHCYC